MPGTARTRINALRGEIARHFDAWTLRIMQTLMRYRESGKAVCAAVFPGAVLRSSEGRGFGGVSWRYRDHPQVPQFTTTWQVDGETPSTATRL